MNRTRKNYMCAVNSSRMLMAECIHVDIPNEYTFIPGSDPTNGTLQNQIYSYEYLEEFEERSQTDLAMAVSKLWRGVSKYPEEFVAAKSIIRNLYAILNGTIKNKLKFQHSDKNQKRIPIVLYFGGIFFSLHRIRCLSRFVRIQLMMNNCLLLCGMAIDQ